MSKRNGRHIANALTPLQVQRLSAPGRHPDGNGLYIEIDRTGAKRWTLRVVRRMADSAGRVVRGTRHDLGLGRVQDVSLADARAKAAELRKAAADGHDVVALHRAVRIAAGTPVVATDVLTFSKVAEQVHASFKAGWSNGKHRDQWLKTVHNYATPIIGNMPIADIEQKHALRCLSPIWLEKQETARRLRQRLKVIFDWAKAHGHRNGDNPIGGIELALPAQTDRVEHHKALAIDDVPSFIVALRAHDADSITKLSTEWLILSATRANETRFAAWVEIDHKAKTWTIPADRMKGRTAHVVPLTPRMVEILELAADLTGEAGLIFANAKRALSENTMTNLAKSVAGDPGLTAHGFRSAFRDWASERTSFPGEVAEAALAHTIKNAVEAAYRRGNLLEKRRELMAAWSFFVAPALAGGNVVALPVRQSA